MIQVNYYLSFPHREQCLILKKTATWYEKDNSNPYTIQKVKYEQQFSLFAITPNFSFGPKVLIFKPVIYLLFILSVKKKEWK